MNKTRTEIASQPQVWAQALEQFAGDTRLVGQRGERVLYLGSGTSAFVANAIAQLREQAGWGESDWHYASEWTPGRPYDRVVVLTRSGTTTEALDVLRELKGTIPTLTVVAVDGTPAVELADDAIVLDFADEESVVQTRFPTTTILIARQALGEDVSGLGAQLQAGLDAGPAAAAGDYEHFVFLGRHWSVGLAMEAALKIREAAQAWSESYPMLDYRHGPIAVATERTVVWLFGEPADNLVRDIEAVGASVVTSGDDPVVQLALAQSFACDMADVKGLNPDTPRALTRSVILDA